jgi:hypothetical protein
MSIDEIRKKALKFQRRIQGRNLTETIGSLFAIGIFALFIKWFPSPLSRLGSCMTIAGYLYVIWRMNGPAAAARVPSDATFEACLTFHRRELARHRDLLRAVWRWYLGPIVPGIVVSMTGAIAGKARHLSDWWRAAPVLVVFAVGFWFIAWLNGRAADCLQRQIDDLDRAVEQ